MRHTHARMHAHAHAHTYMLTYTTASLQTVTTLQHFGTPIVGVVVQSPVTTEQQLTFDIAIFFLRRRVMTLSDVPAPELMPR